MPEKLLTDSDGLVPEPPPPSEWRRAPYLGNGDQFWDKVTTYPEYSTKANPPTTTTTKPLLLEPEPELSQTGDYLAASSIPRLLIERGDFPYSFVEYTSHTGPGCGWLVWSLYILGNDCYRGILTRASIYQSVRLFPFLTVPHHPSSLAVLLSRWSFQTHTFVASWGEFAPSLEDVSVLFHLPMFGDDDSDFSVVSSEEDEEIVGALRNAATEAAQWESRFQGSLLLDSPPPSSNSSTKPTYAQWYRHFFKDYEPICDEIASAKRPRKSVTGPQYGKRYELAAFLSYWLDNFIFEGKPKGVINQRVFPLAAVLSRGHPLPLAPMFLGTLYYRLDMLKEDWARSLGRYEVTTYVSCSFLALFLFERFPLYAPRPKTFAEEARISYGHAMRWNNVTTPHDLHDYIDEFENFCARPYTVKHDGIPFPSFYRDPEDNVVDVLLFITVVSKCALPYITETEEGATAYNPCRVACQFGYDQGQPAGPTSCRGSYTSSCARFRCCQELALQYPASFTMPSIKRQGRYTRRFRDYWANILKLFFAFPSASPQPPDPVPIFEDDISLKAPQKRPNVSRSGLSRFAVATITSTVAAAKNTFQLRRSARKATPSKPQNQARSGAKRQPPLINPRPPKSKCMRMDTTKITNKSASKSERAPDNIPRSHLLVCHDNISAGGSRQLVKPRADDEQRDLSAAKGGCAADVVEEEFASPMPIEIQDSACDRHLNSEDIYSNMPEAENINVAPAIASSADASVPKTSVAPLPPPPEENIGPNELVEWHGYKCRFRSIPYLDCIFNKHPETFDGFRVKSEYFQRIFLDALAKLIKSLTEKNISQITRHNINLARDLMMDSKSVGLDLSWLEQKYADATARLAVGGLNQESARISSELQQTNKHATELRRYLATKEARAASLRARCKELAQKISFQKTLIDSNLSSEDKVLMDFID